MNTPASGHPATTLMRAVYVDEVIIPSYWNGERPLAKQSLMARIENCKTPERKRTQLSNSDVRTILPQIPKVHQQALDFDGHVWCQICQYTYPTRQLRFSTPESGKPWQEWVKCSTLDDAEFCPGGVAELCPWNAARLPPRVMRPERRLPKKPLPWVKYRTEPFCNYEDEIISTSTGQPCIWLENSLMLKRAADLKGIEYGAYMMLMGYSMESLFKGILVSQGPVVTAAGEFDGKFTSHELVDLLHSCKCSKRDNLPDLRPDIRPVCEKQPSYGWKNTTLPESYKFTPPSLNAPEKEEALLKVLTRFTTWAGRYPCPKSPEEFQPLFDLKLLEQFGPFWKDKAFIDGVFEKFRRELDELLEPVRDKEAQAEL